MLPVLQSYHHDRLYIYSTTFNFISIKIKLKRASGPRFLISNPCKGCSHSELEKLNVWKFYCVYLYTPFFDRLSSAKLSRQFLAHASLAVKVVNANVPNFNRRSARPHPQVVVHLKGRMIFQFLFLFEWRPTARQPMTP